MTSNPPPHLDHLILLLPHQLLLNPSVSLTTSFTLTPGGRHADSRTENKLICFRDGSYIELISFIDDSEELKRGHWWGGKSVGWIDFAFTSAMEGGAKGHFEALKGRVEEKGVGGEEVGYLEPVRGGRKRGDGKSVEWCVTFPKGKDGATEGHSHRGRMPFFCHDVTARELRVPVEEGNTVHPCGAVGVKSLAVIVPEEQVQKLGEVYTKILDVEPEDEVAEGKGKKVVFRVGSVHGVSGTRGPVVVIRGPANEDETEKVQKNGFLVGEVVVGVSPKAGYVGKRVRVDVEEDLGGWYVESMESGEREMSGAEVMI